MTEQYWSAIKNTFLYAVVTTIAKNVLGLTLAMVMMKITRGKGFFRTITYMPVTFSYVVCGILWLWIFNPNFGLLNNFLRLIGADSLIMGWLSDSRIAIYSVMMVDVWRWAGFHMVLYLAGLQAISKDYYEAAEIDRRRLFCQIFQDNTSAAEQRDCLERADGCDGCTCEQL